MNNNIRLGAGIPLIRSVNEVDNRLLTVTVSNQEILEAIKGLPAFKTPRPDDIQSIFYQKCWHTGGNWLVIFLHSKHMLENKENIYHLDS